MRTRSSYLRPGTIYHMITTSDTFGVGGYFFSASHFTRSLETIIVEHFHADESAKTEHTRVHVVLFKVLRKYIDGIALKSTFLTTCSCIQFGSGSTFFFIRTSPQR